MRNKKSHWKTRAEDYRQLLKQAKNPEVRQVLEHLERTCTELARTDVPAGLSQPDSWMDDATQDHEKVAIRWRMRQAEYQAMADSSSSDDSRQAWHVIAGRCAEIASYLEAVRPRRIGALGAAGY